MKRKLVFVSSLSPYNSPRRYLVVFLYFVYLQAAKRCIMGRKLAYPTSFYSVFHNFCYHSVSLHFLKFKIFHLGLFDISYSALITFHHISNKCKYLKIYLCFLNNISQGFPAGAQKYRKSWNCICLNCILMSLSVDHF